jgi:hypothetical protein
MSPSGAEWDDAPRRETQRFLLDVVGGHSQVKSIERHDANCYTIERETGDPLLAFVTDVYILGEADYAKLRLTHPDVDLIILASSWNSCTMDVKEKAMEDEIAIHNFKSLMGGLNKREAADFLAHSYSPTDQNGRRPEHWS